MTLHPPKILLATNNPGKVTEFRSLLGKLDGIEILTPEDIGVSLIVKETGKSYAENALLKARAFCNLSGLISLADDSGLEVDALEGAPGLHSARYSGKPNATDADRRELLLDNLSKIPGPWTARFRAMICVAVPGIEHRLAEGICEGVIVAEERGMNGFGYDPIFLLPEKSKTMAEVTSTVKNQISHRAIGIEKILPILEDLLGIRRRWRMNGYQHINYLKKK